MKAVIVVLSVIALAASGPVRPKRSHALGDWGGATYYSAPAYYSAPSYVAPVYTYPESTHVSTHSSELYKVQVPVTYTYTYQQPIHTHSTVYKAPALNTWAYGSNSWNTDPWC